MKTIRTIFFGGMDDYEALFIEAFEARVQTNDHESMSEVVVEQDELKEHSDILKSLPRATIGAIKFTTMTKERVEDLAVCEITRGMDRNGDSLGTVCSKQLGVCHAKDGPCLNCGLTITEGCLGHYGLIRLVRPMFHPPTINVIPSVLNLICHECGTLRVKIDESNPILKLPTGPLRWDRLLQRAGLDLGCSAIIPGKGICGAHPHVYVHHANKTSPNTLRLGRVNQTATDVLDIFRNLKPDNAPRILGFDSIDKLISKFVIEVVPVPPNRFHATNGDIIDPMTTLLDSLWKRNNALRVAIAQHDEATIMIRDAEVFNILTEFGCNSNSSRPNGTKGLLALRLTGKYGLVRGKMFCKRNDNSCRCVMVPGQEESPDTIGVPYCFRRIISPDIRVTRYNLKYVCGLQKRGFLSAIKDPVLGISGRESYIRGGAIDNYFINVGDSVRRFLEEGDLMNYVRNPTLNVRGMLIFRINFCKKRSNQNIRMPYPFYVGYGGDYDGDAGIIFVVWDPLARMEATMMNGPFNFISRIGGEGHSGPHYNALPASRKLSLLKFMPAHQYHACMSVINDFGQMDSLAERLAMHGVRPDSGNGVMSATLPPNTTLGRIGDPIVIRNGVFLCRSGLHANIIRDGEHSIVKAISMQSGNQATLAYVYNFTLLCDEYLRHEMVSVGPDDFKIPMGDPEFVPKLIEGLEDRVQKLYDVSLTDQERESYISTEIVNFSNVITYHIESNFAKHDTALNDMTKSRVSKISKNMVLMRGCVGQQHIDGRRLPTAYAYGIPSPNLNSLLSRGFIKSSFVDGLNPEELIHHFRTSRNALVSQQRTSAPGTLSMHMERSLDRFVVDEIGAVACIEGGVVASQYGVDGFMTNESWISFDNKTFRSPFNYDDFSDGLLQRRVNSRDARALRPGDLIVHNPVVEATTARFDRCHADHLHTRRHYNGPKSDLKRTDGVRPVYAHISRALVNRVLGALATNVNGVPTPEERPTRYLPARIYDRYITARPKLLEYLHIESQAHLFILLWNWENVAYPSLDVRGVEDIHFFDGLLSSLANTLENPQVLKPENFMRSPDLSTTIISAAIYCDSGDAPTHIRAPAVEAWVKQQQTTLRQELLDIQEPNPASIVPQMRDWLARDRSLTFMNYLLPFHRRGEIDWVDCYRGMVMHWEKRLKTVGTEFLVARYRRECGLTQTTKTPLEKRMDVRRFICRVDLDRMTLTKLFARIQTNFAPDLAGFVCATGIVDDLRPNIRRELEDQDRFTGKVSRIQEMQVDGAVDLLADVLALTFYGQDETQISSAILYVLEPVVGVFHDLLNEWDNQQRRTPRRQLPGLTRDGGPCEMGRAFAFEQYLFVLLHTYAATRLGAPLEQTVTEANAFYHTIT